MTTIRRYAPLAAFVAFAAFDLVNWYAWLVVGIAQGVMTHEASPGRAWW